MDKIIEQAQQEHKIIPLQDIPEGSEIHAITNLSVDGKKSVIKFHHPDGRYSYCTVEGHEASKNVIHLSLSTPLIKVDDHYEIASDDANDTLKEVDVDADMPPMDQE